MLAPSPPSAAAARRAWRARARRKAGIRCVRVEVGLDQVDALVDCGLLKAWDSDDATAIARAVEGLLDLAAQRHA